MENFRAIIGARKMEHFTFICPTAWDGYDFSPCFENVFFGFGANIFTLFLFLLSAVIKRKQVQQRSVHTYKIKWLSIIPGFGISLSIVDISMHFITILQGGHFDYHEWLFQSSQVVTWVATLFIMIYDSWYILTQNWALCIWWFVKPLLDFPRLRTHCSSSEGWLSTCFKETCSISIKITFGLMILILWIKNLSGISVNRESHSLKDRLIVCDEENSKLNSHDTNISSIWNSLTFRWVSPLMDLGLKKQINFDDLFQLPHELEPLACHGALRKCWTDEERNYADHPSLFRAIYHTYGWPYLWIGILKAINDGLGFLGPLLLNALIHTLQQDSENGQRYGILCAFGLGILSVSRAFLGAWYSFLLSKLQLQLRASIITILYQKCLSISLSERTIFSTGEIQTLMSVDADRAVNLCASFHDIWSLPLQMGIALFLLYTQVKFAFLAGLAVIVLLIPVNRWIAGKISTANHLMMKQKDERVRKAGELLIYIRTLKMYAWEHFFADRLMETRKHEVKHLATRKYLDAWCVYFWATTPTLFSLFTFSLYALLGYSLDAATVVIRKGHKLCSIIVQ